MDIYSSIFTRKSVRKFDMTPLSKETIGQIETFAAGVKPLLQSSKLTYKIVRPEAVKGMGLPKSPHFLLIYGTDQPLRGVCAGFYFQQVELYLYSIGLANRWLSTLKDKERDPNFIAGFAFGKPDEPDSRTLGEFDRKSVTEIAKGTDSRLEAVRLAPSGMNGQPWYFIVNGKAVHVYYKKSLGGVKGMLYHMTDIDVGLALGHMAVASKHEGKPFNFSVKKKMPEAPKSFTYVGTVE